MEGTWKLLESQNNQILFDTVSENSENSVSVFAVLPDTMSDSVLHISFQQILARLYHKIRDHDLSQKTLHQKGGIFLSQQFFLKEES